VFGLSVAAVFRRRSRHGRYMITITTVGRNARIPIQLRLCGALNVYSQVAGPINDVRVRSPLLQPLFIIHNGRLSTIGYRASPVANCDLFGRGLRFWTSMYRPT